MSGCTVRSNCISAYEHFSTIFNIETGCKIFLCLAVLKSEFDLLDGMHVTEVNDDASDDCAYTMKLLMFMPRFNIEF